MLVRYWQTHLLSRYTVDQRLTNQQLGLETGCKDTDAKTPSESPKVNFKQRKVISTGGWEEGGQQSAGRTEWRDLVENLKYNNAIRQSSRVPMVTPGLCIHCGLLRQHGADFRLELNIPQRSLPIHSMYAQAAAGCQGDLHLLGHLGIPTGGPHKFRWHKVESGRR